MRIWIRTAFYLFVVFGLSSSYAGAYVDFFRAVNRDDARTVNALLAEGFDPNSLSERGQVALYLALRDESPKVVEALLAHPQIKVDLPNAAGETPLMMAAMRGELAAARQLIDRGAQVQRAGWTPLHYAASGPEPKMLSLLLDRGAVIDAPAPNGSTALMMATQFGPEDTVLLLLARGANPKLRNGNNQTAADFARQADREKLALKLDQASR
jgi:uncharacterized protein